MKKTFTIIEMLIGISIISMIILSILSIILYIGKILINIEIQKNINEEIIYVNSIFLNISNNYDINYTGYGLLDEKYGITKTLRLTNGENFLEIYGTGDCENIIDSSKKDCWIEMDLSGNKIPITNKEKTILKNLYFKIIPFENINNVGIDDNKKYNMGFYINYELLGIKGKDKIGNQFVSNFYNIGKLQFKNQIVLIDRSCETSIHSGYSIPKLNHLEKINLSKYVSILHGLQEKILNVECKDKNLIYIEKDGGILCDSGYHEDKGYCVSDIGTWICLGALPSNSQINNSGYVDYYTKFWNGISRSGIDKSWEYSLIQGECKYKCNSGFIQVGGLCEENKCKGTIDLNGEKNETSEDLSKNWNYSEIPGICTYKCKSGYKWNGNICEENKCKGTIDLNGEKNETSEDLSKNWNYSEIPGECTYKCKSGYKWNGNICEEEISLISPTSRIVNCDGIPKDASYYNGKNTYSIIQNWNGTIWTPSEIASYNCTPQKDTCEFKCSGNKLFDGKNCLDPENLTGGFYECETKIYQYSNYNFYSPGYFIGNNIQDNLCHPGYRIVYDSSSFSTGTLARILKEFLNSGNIEYSGDRYMVWPRFSSNNCGRATLKSNGSWIGTSQSGDNGTYGARGPSRCGKIRIRCQKEDSKCGTMNNHFSYNDKNTSYTFCEKGAVKGIIPNFPEQGEKINWECEGNFSKVSCEAQRGKFIYSPTDIKTYGNYSFYSTGYYLGNYITNESFCSPGYNVVSDSTYITNTIWSGSLAENLKDFLNSPDAQFSDDRYLIQVSYYNKNSCGEATIKSYGYVYGTGSNGTNSTSGGYNGSKCDKVRLRCYKKNKCGSENGKIYNVYSSSYNSNNFCSEGNLVGSFPKFPEQGEEVKWKCGTNDSFIECSAKRSQFLTSQTLIKNYGPFSFYSPGYYIGAYIEENLCINGYKIVDDTTQGTGNINIRSSNVARKSLSNGLKNFLNSGQSEFSGDRYLVRPRFSSNACGWATLKSNGYWFGTNQSGDNGTYGARGPSNCGKIRIRCQKTFAKCGNADFKEYSSFDTKFDPYKLCEIGSIDGGSVKFPEQGEDAKWKCVDGIYNVECEARRAKLESSPTKYKNYGGFSFYSPGYYIGNNIKNNICPTGYKIVNDNLNPQTCGNCLAKTLKDFLNSGEAEFSLDRYMIYPTLDNNDTCGWATLKTSGYFQGRSQDGDNGTSGAFGPSRCNKIRIRCYK